MRNGHPPFRRNRPRGVANDSTPGRTSIFDMDRLAAVLIAAGVGVAIVFGVAAFISGSVTPLASVMLVVACLVSVSAHRHPLIAGYANVLPWAYACLIPGASGAIAVTALPVSVSCTLAARRDIRHGAIIVSMQMLALIAGLVLGVVAPRDGPGMVVVLALVLAPVAGLLMSWRERLDRARAAERELAWRRHIMREQERRAVAVTRIHDRVTNRLAYLILRIGNDRSGWEHRGPAPDVLDGELSELSSIAHEVLEETRNVIDLLDGVSSTPAGEAADKDESGGERMDETAMLRDHLAEAADRLAALGFHVDAAMSGELPDGYRVDVVNAMHDLIDETASNIAKHAMPRTECDIRINVDGTRMTLVSHNRRRTDTGSWSESVPGRSAETVAYAKGDAMSSGTGLLRKANRARELGGRLGYASRGTVWRLRADLPVAGPTCRAGQNNLGASTPGIGRMS